MNTSQSAKNSSQAPPGQLNSKALQKYQNHIHQFQPQPIQHQPLVSNITKPFDAGKINATATHIELEQQQSTCDISSLLNMSCRGRAEAFARSLQSRLRTLGSQVSIFDCKLNFHINFFYLMTEYLFSHLAFSCSNFKCQCSKSK